MTYERNKARLGIKPQHTRSTSIVLQDFLTLKVVVPYSLVVWTVSGRTLVILVINSSKYLQDFSKCVVLIIIWTSSVSPIFCLLMTFCRELLRVLVSNRSIDLRITSSTSAELR